MDAILVLAEACTLALEREIPPPPPMMDPYVVLAKACKRTLETLMQTPPKKQKMTEAKPAKPVKPAKLFKPKVNEKGEAAKIIRMFYHASAEKRAAALEQARGIIQALENVHDSGFLSKTLDVLVEMFPLAVYSNTRGKVPGSQLQVSVLSFGQADNFVIDWHKRCKTFYPSWCFDAAISSFHYSGHTAYLISKVEGDAHKYLCVAGSGDLFLKTARAGFQPEASRAMECMAREVEAAGISEEIRLKQAAHLPAGAPPRRPVVPQTNYVHLTNKAEFLREMWTGGDAAIRARVLKAMDTVGIPDVIISEQTKLLDELIPPPLTM
jgi:hypothetical protein